MKLLIQNLCHCFCLFTAEIYKRIFIRQCYNSAIESLICAKTQKPAAEVYNLFGCQYLFF